MSGQLHMFVTLCGSVGRLPGDKRPGMTYCVTGYGEESITSAPVGRRALLMTVDEAAELLERWPYQLDGFKAVAP